MANTVYPITLEQESPVPGLGGQIPDLYKQMNKMTGSFN
jgi:hypothetical protein